ncbi:MAG: rhomboid family intramembrane serine protease [Myxococcota bacterium]
MARTLTKHGSTAITRVQQTAGTLATGVGALWLVEVLNLVLGGALVGFGIHPWTLQGLVGILFAPFLHASLAHLAMNSVWLVVLGGILLMRNPRDFWSVSVVGAIGSGLGAWALGGVGTVHIGLSGVLFAYLGFLMTRGLFERSLVAIALSVGVTWLFGSMVWGVLPLAIGVSWQAHLFGFLSGVLAAAQVKVQAAPRARRKRS